MYVSAISPFVQNTENFPDDKISQTKKPDAFARYTTPSTKLPDEENFPTDNTRFISKVGAFSDHCNAMNWSPGTNSKTLKVSLYSLSHGRILEIIFI